LALVSQGEEKLLFFKNLGNGKFEKNVLLQKHPAFGFVRFELADFDKNGETDILLLNGDNGDLPGKPLRPYHGLHILYQHAGKFAEKFIPPMHGVVEAVVADFNADGWPDIAAVANYPDYASGLPENLVVLENRQSHFKAYHY